MRDLRIVVVSVEGIGHSQTDLKLSKFYFSGRRGDVAMNEGVVCKKFQHANDKLENRKFTWVVNIWYAVNSIRRFASTFMR